jgi:hypothetical protein
MKPIKLSESEKRNILKLHGSNILVEQSTGKTIADIQTLVGTTPDNKLGPKTLAAIKTKLGQPEKYVTTTTTTITPKKDELAKDETMSKGKQEVEVGGSTSLTFGSKEPSFDSKDSATIDSRNV